MDSHSSSTTSKTLAHYLMLGVWSLVATNAPSVGTASSPSDFPTVQIAPGVDMPLLGFGTGTFDEPPINTYHAVVDALNAGYRMIDTAHNYDNQKLIAQAIRDTRVDRSDIFITSKVPGCLSYNDTLAVNEESLSELNTTYVDLMLIHFPNFNDTVGNSTMRQEQWRAMEEFHRQGKARAIGVSHFCQHHMQDILDIATVPIAANQVEYHVGMYGGADSQAWMADNNITLLSYLPLCGQCDGFERYELINGSLVNGIGQDHNKSGAQVSIRWLVQSGVPAIPRSTNPVHIKENLDVMDFYLSAAELTHLNAATAPPAADGPGADCPVP